MKPSFLNYVLYAALLLFCGSCGNNDTQKIAEPPPPRSLDLTNEMIYTAVEKDAYRQLQIMCNLQQTYRSTYKEYAANTFLLGFSKDYVAPGEMVNFVIEVKRATPGEFLMQATISEDFDGDGFREFWQINQDCEHVIDSLQQKPVFKPGS